MGRKGIWVGFGALSVLALGCGQTARNGDAQGGSPGSAGTAPAAAGDGVGGGHHLPSAGSSSGSTASGGVAAGGSGGALGGDAGADNLSNGGSGGGNNGGSTNQAGAASSILDVKPSPGCGEPAPQALGELIAHTLQTEGVKDANCADKLADGTPKCGPWSVEREYYLGLPQGYDPQKAYPLVIQAPGCGGKGNAIYPLTGVSDSVIRVGLTPPPISIGHGTNPGQYCFDDKEGDDSVDFVFYEKLLDTLKNALCYDENRVYVSGESSGSWLANELACKYAGDTKGHAVRALAVNDGGLPNQAQYMPTCSGKPVAGMWVYHIAEENGSNAATKFAIARAMSTDSCVGATNWDDALAKGQLLTFPIGGGFGDETCKLIKDCDPLYPLVVCPRPANGQASDALMANIAMVQFFKSLAAR